MLNTKQRTLKLLVVDDMESIRALVKSILRNMGFTNVLTVATGERAMNILHSTKVDLVICDLNLPDSTGLDIIKSMRAHSTNQNTPFIMLTGERDPNIVKEAISLKITDYLVKPFQPAKLEENVTKIIKRFYNTN